MRTVAFISAAILVHYGHPWPAFVLVSLLWGNDWAQLEAARDLLKVEKGTQRFVMPQKFSRN